MTNVLITGAAGNLGSLLSRHISESEKDLNLILMQHHKKIPKDKKIGKVILISFPHVEGPTSRKEPATGKSVFWYPGM